ncbi:MAG: hypothetical protein LBJ86_02540, partial [Spirochaetaceae bacterium]|nr:hypothetical protein [Spirochaetaceae bacterium]
MIAIEQTVDIAADGRLRLDMALPETVPAGRTSVVLVFPFSEEPPRRYAPEPFPSIEELMAEIDRKAAERFADPSGDSLQKYCGCLEDVFTEDGVEYQR